MLHGVEWLGRQYSALSKGAAANQSLIQTINTLAIRLSEAAKSEEPNQERRAAVLTLKGLAKDHPHEVAVHAGKQLLECLVRDVGAAKPGEVHDEVAKSLLECILAVCTPPEQPVQKSTFPFSKKPQLPPVPIALDQFLETSQPLHALLPLLSPSRSFYLRFAALQLLGLLLRHRKSLVQSHILTSPGGCGAILECLATVSETGHSLGSSAEIIRNEALLLLPHLVDSNTDIQKLIAFEGAFEKLLDVVAQEGRIEGGVVAQDALEALEALLRYNVSNQNYFRETLSIPLLAPLLFFPPPLPPNAPAHVAGQRDQQLESFAFQPWEYDASDEYGTEGDPTGRQSGPQIVGDTQKLINARLVIGIAGLLVQGVGEGKRANQNALLSTGFFHALLNLALASSAPIPIKTQALQVLASLMKGSRAVQDALGEASVTPVEPIQVQVAADYSRPDPAAANTADGNTALENSSVEQAVNQGPAMVEFARLPPQSALIALIHVALNGMPGPHRAIDGGLRSLTGFRAAAVKTLQSILSHNVDARLFVIASMASSEQSDPAQQPGHVLLEALTKLPANGEEPGFDEYKALFAGMILATVLKGAESVKDLARRLQYTSDGRLAIVPAEEEGASKKSSDDDDDASLLSVLIGNLTIALRAQADAVKAERSQAQTSVPTGKGPSSTSWSRVLVAHLTLLALWLHNSPKSVGDLLSDSSNLHTIVQTAAEGANGEQLTVGLATWLLGIVYEYAPLGKTAESSGAAQEKGAASNQKGAKKGKKGNSNEAAAADKKDVDADKITRQEIFDLVSSRIGLDQFEARLDRLGDDHRLRLVGPDILEKVAQRVDPVILAAAGADKGNTEPPASAGPTGALQAAAKEKEAATKDAAAVQLQKAREEENTLPEIWFDWTFAEFWRYENATISKSLHTPPHVTSATFLSYPAELSDAKEQIEHLRDEVTRLEREVEARDRLIHDALEREKIAGEEKETLTKQISEVKASAATGDGEIARLRGEIEQHTTAAGKAADEHRSALDGVAARARDIERLLQEEKARSETISGELAGAKAAAAAAAASSGSEEAEQVKVLKEQLEAATRQNAESSKASAAIGEDLSSLKAQLEAAKKEVEDAKKEAATAKEEAAAAKSEAESAKSTSTATAGTTTGDAAASNGSSARVSELEQENQDLLVMLDELSTKKAGYKARLKSKGEEVSEDEEEDDDDGDDEQVD